MLRSEVLQPLIDLSAGGAYLEIGIEGGVTFHAITAARKVAVDPIFRFEVPSPRLSQSVEYHELTSDEFFADLCPSEMFDVIYIDGLHTVEQTLRDLMNSVEHLKPGGAIVVDDVVPTSWAASLCDQSDAAFVRKKLLTESVDGNNWMGPVFRLVYFVECFMPSFQYATVQENHGQLIMWRQRRPVVLSDLTLEKISRMDFLEVLKNTSVFRIMPYERIIDSYCEASRKHLCSNIA